MTPLGWVLAAQGDLLIGKSGSVTGDIEKMGIVVNDGKIIGNVNVERIELRGKVRRIGYRSSFEKPTRGIGQPAGGCHDLFMLRGLAPQASIDRMHWPLTPHPPPPFRRPPQASVHGNITCKSLKVDPTVVIVGTLNVNPFAPSKIDPQGNIIADDQASQTTKSAPPATQPATAAQAAPASVSPVPFSPSSLPHHEDPPVPPFPPPSSSDSNDGPVESDTRPQCAQSMLTPPPYPVPGHSLPLRRLPPRRRSPRPRRARTGPRHVGDECPRTRPKLQLVACLFYACGLLVRRAGRACAYGELRGR